jgi:hypothetical protein
MLAANQQQIISPSIEEPAPEEWQPSKPKLRRRYVKRGSVYRRAKDASIKLKEGEKVFIKIDHHYQEIGVVENNTLQIVYMENQR